MTPTAPQTPRRHDARQNRERLLAAAADVFTEQGVEAPLDAIARGAGIGNATMYRHFPTREALLEAVVHERYEALGARAEELLDSASPAAALADWFREFVACARTFNGLPAPILTALREEGSALHASCAATRAGGARLLGRAQRSGEIREDIDATDLFAQAAGTAWAIQRAPDDPGRADRLIAVLFDGLRSKVPTASGP